MEWPLVAFGLFVITAAFMDWEWFMGSRKARFWVSLFGRVGARIFYGLLGATIATIGVLIATGVTTPRR